MKTPEEILDMDSIEDQFIYVNGLVVWEEWTMDEAGKFIDAIKDALYWRYNAVTYHTEYDIVSYELHALQWGKFKEELLSGKPVTYLNRIFSISETLLEPYSTHIQVLINAGLCQPSANGTVRVYRDKLWPCYREWKKKGMKPLPASIAFEKLKKLDGKNFALGTLKEYASDFGPDHKKYN
jgi:hypothetical protein